jgi:hypothetical protein
LLLNFQSRRYWFGKGGDIGWYGVGYWMQVLNWQGKIVSESTMAVNDAQHSPVFTMSWLSTATESTLPADGVNLAYHPMSE